MQTEKFRAVTVRIEPQVWRGIEILAAADKRPTANFLRLVLSDLVAAKAGEKQVAA